MAISRRRLLTMPKLHAFALGATLAGFREVTGGLAVSGQACNTWCAMSGGLDRREGDTHPHVHGENTVPLPRAVELERRHIVKGDASW